MARINPSSEVIPLLDWNANHGLPAQPASARDGVFDSLCPRFFPFRLPPCLPASPPASLRAPPPQSPPPSPLPPASPPPAFFSALERWKRPVGRWCNRPPHKLHSAQRSRHQLHDRQLPVLVEREATAASATAPSSVSSRRRAAATAARTRAAPTAARTAPMMARAGAAATTRTRQRTGSSRRPPAAPPTYEGHQGGGKIDNHWDWGTGGGAGAGGDGAGAGAYGYGGGNSQCGGSSSSTAVAGGAGVHFPSFSNFGESGWFAGGVRGGQGICPNRNAYG